MSLLTLQTDTLVVQVALDHGGEIRHVGAPGQPNILAELTKQWPLRASRSVSYGSSRDDWLSEFRGGWQELFPNAGSECVVGGIAHPFHGEVSTAEWDLESCGTDHARLSVATRGPVTLERRLRLRPDRAVLAVEGTARNQGSEPAYVIWGQHLTFPLEPAMLVDAPAGTVAVDGDWRPALGDLTPGARGQWPYIESAGGRQVDLRTMPQRPSERLCYLTDVHAGWAALRDLSTLRGVALAWDAEVFRHIWLYEQLGGGGWPYFGSGRLLGLEPHSAWPQDGLAAAIDRGQAHRIAPGEQLECWLTLALFECDARAVASVDQSGGIGYAAGPATA